MTDYGAMTAVPMSADEEYAAHAIKHLRARIMVAPDGSRWVVKTWEIQVLRRQGWRLERRSAS